jgi:HPt (histidine-containing phosphotransfer) domain-containing protein
MDMQMPVLDGHAATRQIRQWEVEHHKSPTPILALTANAQTKEGTRCRASGCTAFLTKPIRKAALLTALAKYIPLSRVPADQPDLLPAVKQLVPGYLKQRRIEVDRLWEAIAAGDYTTISTLGHMLKGSGASYGFEELSRIGEAIELAARASHPQETHNQVGLLAAAISKIEAVGAWQPHDQHSILDAGGLNVESGLRSALDTRSACPS